MTNSEDMLLVGGMPVPSVVLFSDENTFGMSLGIIFLGTYLRKFNYSVDVFDPIIYYSKMYKKRKQAIPRKLTNIQRKKYTDSILELTHDRLKQILREKKFKIIGVSTSSLIDLDLRNMSIVREMQPDSLIIAGGPGLSLRPENVLAISEADIVVIGEGEIICKTLLDRIKKHDLKYPISKDDYDKYFSDIPFITCKVIEKNGINIYTSIANKDDYVKKYLPEVNKLPLPDFKLLDAHLKEHTQFMYTNRSCPSLCTFCSMASLKKKMSHDCGFGINTLMKRWMEPEKVIDWIIFLYNNCNNLRDISFNEDTFTYPIERAKRICKLIIKNKKSGKIGNDVTFFCQTRSNLIDEELLHLMKEAGFTQISYGAESGSNDMLKCIRKGFTTNDTLNAIDMTLESGLMPSINLILFLPKSKIHDCIKTIELAMYCYENGAILETNDIIVPYYGTDIEMKYRNGNNIINNKI
ncbi:MAG: radical SAM protein, partial [Nanoarchaeota archaeon]|nr:radical SAM protein [Nanoarchaeota archaeon]